MLAHNCKHMHPSRRGTQAFTNICALLRRGRSAYTNIYALMGEECQHIHMHPRRGGVLGALIGEECQRTVYTNTCTLIGQECQDIQIYAPSWERSASIYKHMCPQGGVLSDYTIRCVLMGLERVVAARSIHFQSIQFMCIYIIYIYIYIYLCICVRVTT